MAGSIDEDVVAFGRPHPNAREIEGNRLIALQLEGVEEKRILDRCSPFTARLFEFRQFRGSDILEIDEQTPEDRRFTGVDVADHDDANLTHMYPDVRNRSKASSVSLSIERPARSG